MWYDRDYYKKSIMERFQVGSKFSVINVADAREMADCADWIKNNSKQYSITGALFNTDAPAKKYALLESLMLDIGGRSKFDSYYKYLNNLNTYDKYDINQEIGNQSIAGKEIKINKAEQNIHIHESNNEQKPLQVLKEERIDELLDKFICDLDSFSDSILFLIQFGNKGFSNFTEEFQQWFSQTFCRKLLSELENINICVLDRSDWNILLEAGAERQDISEKLKIDDIIKGAKPYMEQPKAFADTLLSLFGGDEMPYTDVIRAFRAYCKRQEIGV